MIKKGKYKWMFPELEMNQEHYLEPVVELEGVQYVNDSRATNVNACWFALEMTARPIIWIAGGVGVRDYAPVVQLAKEKVKAIVCLAEDETPIHRAFSDAIILHAYNMVEAVHMAKALADPGDTVLLSPGAASFDLFEDFKERGRQFKQCVMEYHPHYVGRMAAEVVGRRFYVEHRK